MQTRIAVIAIIVDDRSKSEELNQILHQYGEYIVGRMGVPYRPKDVSVISVILDAPQEKISALSGKLGMLEGVTSKTVYSKLSEKSV
ncbi:iron-only hydrogenase system regulator [Blautia schinkii]|nr:iron-only hydrogenase system regulator [Blautia schinkii]